MTESETDALMAQVDRLRIRAHRAARAHYLAGKSADSRHRWLGIPSVILSTVVGSAIFASLAGGTSTPIVILTGIASLLVAALAALQTFFGFEDQAQQHRKTGTEYAALKRGLDLLRLSIHTQNLSGPQAIEELKDLVATLDDLEGRSIDPPDRFYDRARREQDLDSEGI